MPRTRAGDKSGSNKGQQVIKSATGRAESGIRVPVVPPGSTSSTSLPVEVLTFFLETLLSSFLLCFLPSPDTTTSVTLLMLFPSFFVHVLYSSFFFIVVLVFIFALYCESFFPQTNYFLDYVLWLGYKLLYSYLHLCFCLVFCFIQVLNSFVFFFPPPRAVFFAY